MSANFKSLLLGAAMAVMLAPAKAETRLKDGALDMEGVRNVLKLRAQFEGGTPASPEKYIDLSYYQKALAGM